MIYSMTAFARTDDQGDWGSLFCEIRSVNHRYLEINVQLPDMLRALEMMIREHIRQTIKRGKVECSFRYHAAKELNGNTFSVNMALARRFCETSESIASLLKHASPVSPADVLLFPGVLEMKETDSSVLQNKVFKLLEKALHELIAAREREGKELKQLFFERLNLMQQELAKVRERLPLVLHDQKDRLQKRLADVIESFDPLRIEQEMVFFSQKIDVAEEVERTETHIAEVKRILDQGGMVGRRLDFLLQELNREANTLGSKSLDASITHSAVEMKVLIEQIREQVQNIE